MQAAAQSVLAAGRAKGGPYARAGQSSLAPEGEAIGIELEPAAGFRRAKALPSQSTAHLAAVYRRSRLNRLRSGVGMPRNGNWLRIYAFIGAVFRGLAPR
jgi:hypothetical protein